MTDKVDFTHFIPIVIDSDPARTQQIIKDLEVHPDKCRNYIAKILEMSPKSESLQSGEFWPMSNRIAFYIREYQVRRTKTLAGFRAFDIEVLAVYLASTRYKV